MRYGKDSKRAGAGYISIDGEEYSRILDYDLMPPFLMSIPSDTDLWMFIASSGGLTAGRVDPDGSIFPYETVDRLYDGHHHTGPVTLIRVEGGEYDGDLWEPFSACPKDPGCRRNLYKSVAGNSVIFEEIYQRLKLTFRYRWSASDEFGHIRTCTITSSAKSKLRLSILDGLRNILPCGAPLALYQQSSSLVDAYKRTDLDPGSGMAVYSLTSRIIDRAEAAEQLRANVAWCSAPFDFSVYLPIETISLFRDRKTPPSSGLLTGRRGNYLIASEFDISPGERLKWHISADACRDHLQLVSLKGRLLESGDLGKEIEGSLAASTDNLVRIVGSADGIQKTGDPDAVAHHFANVLFNCMRGGIFSSGYDIQVEDFRDFVRTRNRPVAEDEKEVLGSLPGSITTSELLKEMEETGNADLVRLVYEYMPLYFGRRHGDPSRPWNRFSIRVNGPGGKKVLYYEGNWRDIFQNWEALCLSFPGFIPGMIAKFVNASTVDGFNPYRITRDGIDWEVSDPDDPWSYIGYWGDHQIIYLLKFLEALPRYYPGVLNDMMTKEVFAYADVPYSIKPYDQIVDDPRSTIDYDAGHAANVALRVDNEGTDGKLVLGPSGGIYHVNLLEKLLVPVLAKISCLVPGGGIWMNTQRPEWNDANNALAGNGLSAVTLYYLRRHISCLMSAIKRFTIAGPEISIEVADWMERINGILGDGRAALESSPEIDDSSRRRIMDALGKAFEEYRGSVYSNGFSGKKRVHIGKIDSFLEITMQYIDHSIEANRRADGLFHSYNILEMKNESGQAQIERLYEMLEGQVAAISSGVLEPDAVAELLSSLYDSQLYRRDQNSFMLYPEKDLPAFLDINAVPDESLKMAPLLRELLERGDGSIVAMDRSGVVRFSGDFSNADDLSKALEHLAEDPEWKEKVGPGRAAVLDIFEEVFRHKAFTGRSGRMYGYEGLGCIYWHMVSKLLLAVQEAALKAFRKGLPETVKGSLAGYYYRIRSGLSFEKTAGEYGAFPTDPYSHTPKHAGAQQPGMTGQVKEEIITRLGELGVVVDEGRVIFDPVILRRSEFLSAEADFGFYGIDGKYRTITVPEGCLAFTFCQVPVIYHLTAGEKWLEVESAGGSKVREKGCLLDRVSSRPLFDRTGSVSRIDVGIGEDVLLLT
ncbi:MAG: hypothetical protein JW746_03720 [Candidatus Krumholzibacteriota bacterium]|nr:hypothetical protein [Candidatus Krumholzibacteriota bacterium]